MPVLDLVIPLGIGSKHGNDELRILLRSVERNVRDIGRVVVVTQAVPDWLQNAVVVKCGDPLKHNKDGNLIRKVLTALDKLDIRGKFCLSADDAVFFKEIRLADCPLLFNSRGRDEFDANGKRWHRRMVRTFMFFGLQGCNLNHNYEVHAPQVFDADLIRKVIPTVDYQSDIGYCIYTLFRGMCHETGGVEQSPYKDTIEEENQVDAPLDKLFVGYNDTAFDAGLRERLFGIFSEKSKYER